MHAQPRLAVQSHRVINPAHEVAALRRARSLTLTSCSNAETKKHEPDGAPPKRRYLASIGMADQLLRNAHAEMPYLTLPSAQREGKKCKIQIYGNPASLA
jgi:hypothetical protein